MMRWIMFPVLMAGFLLLIPTAALAQDRERATRVVITTDVTEAEAFLNGERVGLTPARVEDVPPGEYTVTVRAAGRSGTRTFELRQLDRTIHVPLATYERPLSLGLEGTLGFRGDAALLGTGLGLHYHLLMHELGIVGNYFDIRGEPELTMQGIMAHLEYAFVPWSLAGSPAGDTWISPLKIRGRINIAQTTTLREELNGAVSETTVAALGGGVGLGAELQSGRLGIEPSFYYDWYASRRIEVGTTDLRPPLDNGGFNIRIKFYF